MLKTLKRLFEKNRRFLEAYGGESTRNTYIGQLNYESGKIFFVLYITAVIWLPYIFSDMRMHQYPSLAVGIRLALTGVSISLIALRCHKAFRNRPMLLLMILTAYIYLGTVVVTATSGPAAPAYIGGFTIVLMMPIFAPFPFKYKAFSSLFAFAAFFIVAMASGLDFTDTFVLYSINDLLSVIFVCLLLSHSQDVVRHEAWRQQQKLNGMVSQQERNLATIFKLASEAEMASKTKSDFLANMSHEIRTPMNAIIGISELMMQKNLQPDIYEDALAIQHAGNNLLAIINDILDISKIESGKLEITPGEYSFASVFHDTCSIIRTRLSEKNLLFLTYVDSRLPNMLYGDETRVRQILLNLLSNAAKYTQQGFVSISVDGEIDGDTVHLKICVADSGIGIREEDIEKLFNKFVQVDAQKNRGIEGTGLGLAIARQLCVMMGGDITVESEYARGSAFTVSIPQQIVDRTRMAIVEDPQNARTLLYEVRPLYEESAARTFANLEIPYQAVNRQADFSAQLKTGGYRYIFVPVLLYDGVKHLLEDNPPEGDVVLLAEFGDSLPEGGIKALSMPISCFSVASVLNDEEIRDFQESRTALNSFIAPEAKILIVDDIAMNLKVAEGLMSHFKMQIDLCGSGEKAIEMALQNNYDIIFMDHMMPGMDGIESTAQIRDLGAEYENLPIIALTANAVSGMKEMFIANGLNDFLAKPIEISKLNAVLANWLPKEKQQKEWLPKDAAEKNTAESPCFAIEGVDISAGIRNAGGNEKGYAEILRYFCLDGNAKRGEIATALLQEEIKLYTTYVHALKGAAANIGADRLSALAKDLEAAAGRGDLEYAQANTEAFLNELEKTTGRISAFLQQQETPPQVPEQDEATILHKLENLKTALADIDTDTIDSLVQSLNVGRMTQTMEKIAQNILLFNYEQATALIDEYIQMHLSA